MKIKDYAIEGSGATSEIRKLVYSMYIKITFKHIGGHHKTTPSYQENPLIHLIIEYDWKSRKAREKIEKDK